MRTTPAADTPAKRPMPMVLSWFMAAFVRPASCVNPRSDCVACPTAGVS